MKKNILIRQKPDGSIEYLVFLVSFWNAEKHHQNTTILYFLWGLDDSNWGLQGILKFGLTISKVQLICLINVADFSAGYSWNVYKDILMQLNFILIDLNAAKLSTACFECY